MIRLAVRVAREHAELALAELMVLAPAGLEEREVDGAVEYVLYGAPGELPDLGSVKAAVGAALVDVTTTVLPDDWGQDWRRFHTPIDAGPVRVRPPWAEAREGAHDIVIEPGQAFGTGAHATTRLTLELLCALEPDGALADWGCGSGVLAIAAAKLGWAPVLACDIEPESVDAARAAAARNGAEIDVTLADVRHGGPPAPTVLANLVRPLLLTLAENLTNIPDRMIISGLEGDEPDEVVPAFTRHGLHEVARRAADGWSAVELRMLEDNGSR